MEEDIAMVDLPGKKPTLIQIVDGTHYAKMALVRTIGTPSYHVTSASKASFLLANSLELTLTNTKRFL